MKLKLFLLAIVVILIPLSLMGQTIDTLITGSSIQLSINATAQVVVVCPNGYQVVSGGWDGSGGSNQLNVSRSLPGNNGTLNEWQFTFHNGGNTAITVHTYIICKRAFLSTVLKTETEFPKSSELSQNYPNPFNPSTTFDYSLNTRSTVRIEVFNEAGQLINTLVDGMMETGNYQISWNGKSSSGTGVSSGVYFYRLKSDGLIQTKKMILIK